MITTRDLPQLQGRRHSDRTAALMASLAALAYDYPPAGSPPGPAPAAAAPGGIGLPGRVVFPQWAGRRLGVRSRKRRPHRGRLPRHDSIQNWKTDFHAAMVHPDPTDPNLRVHAGFFAAFQALYDGDNGLAARFAKDTNCRPIASRSTSRDIRSAAPWRRLRRPCSARISSRPATHSARRASATPISTCG